MAVTLSANVVKGTLRTENRISCKLETINSLKGVVLAGASGICKPYSGEYEVTPTIDGQVLETYDRHMEDNLTINPIPYFEVSNEQKGQTVIIGG